MNAYEGLFLPKKPMRAYEPLLLAHTFLQSLDDGLAVHIPADEDELLHAVAVGIVPVGGDSLVLAEEVAELILRHRGIPLTGVAETNLTAGLLEDIACLLLVGEIADTLTADNRLGPTL